jgi:hypothetical protein
MRRLPTGVFVALAVVALVFGGVWWLRAAPPASAAENTTPLSRMVTVRLDDGRVLTFQRGRSVISEPSQRRYCRRSTTQYPNMRIVGQDAPPVFLTRCSR